MDDRLHEFINPSGLSRAKTGIFGVKNIPEFTEQRESSVLENVVGQEQIVKENAQGKKVGNYEVMKEFSKIPYNLVRGTVELVWFLPSYLRKVFPAVDRASEKDDEYFKEAAYIAPGFVSLIASGLSVGAAPAAIYYRLLQSPEGRLFAISQLTGAGLSLAYEIFRNVKDDMNQKLNKSRAGNE